MELNLNPAYLWGGDSLKPGAPGDCTGKLYAILASCGFPVQRIPATMIYNQKGGWRFPIVIYAEGKMLAIVIMTAKKNRPHGHAGILMTDVQFGKLAKMAHASSSAGFIQVILKPGSYWYPKIDRLLQVKQ